MPWWIQIVISVLLGVPVLILVIGGLCTGIAWLMVIYTERIETKRDAGKKLNWFERLLEKIANIILKE